jgi:hypothetical protein
LYLRLVHNDALDLLNQVNMLFAYVGILKNRAVIY